MICSKFRALLVTLVYCFTALAPAQQLPTTKPATSWEYLIVSFGKTYFSDLADAKQSGLSKMTIYSPIGFNLGSEAVETQRKMDALGRYGWELVGLVGAVGGDQQMVFKRTYDPARSLKEAEQITAEAKALEDAKKGGQQPASTAPPTNLDVADADTKENSLRESANRTLKDATDLVMSDRTGEVLVSAAGVATFDRGSDRESITGANVDFAVVIDATASILKDGTYRGSQVRKLAKERAESIARVAQLKELSDVYPTYGTVFIRVSVVVQKDGKTFPVGSGFELKYFKL